MSKRPILDNNLDSKTFQGYYWLKEELVNFCKHNGLQATGSKSELAARIAKFLETGEKTSSIHSRAKANIPNTITLGTKIEDDFICSEKHRKFYKEQIGKSFSFNVLFQKWLKQNAGKTYAQSIVAYYQILEDKKQNKTTIGGQFEYNTYIRDFFAENQDKTLEDAIKCWKYKKSQRGSNKYEKADLVALTQ